MSLGNNLVDVCKKLSNQISKKSPEVLTGAGIVCSIVTTVLAVKATPKAMKAIDERKKELDTEELTVTETIKTAGKYYIPSISTGVASVCFAIGSVTESNRRLTALSASYEILKDAAYTYKNKVIETIGEKKEQKIRESIAQDKIAANTPVVNGNVPPEPRDGVHRQLYYEPLCHKYFWETPARFEIAKANAIHKMGYDDTLSVFDWLSELPANVLSGYPDGMAGRFMDIGWNKSDPYYEFDIKTRATEIMEGEFRGYGCLVIEYSCEPASDYRNVY